MLEDVKKKLNLSQSLKPESLIFWNLVLDKGTLKNFISWFLENYGEKKTLKILEELKYLGFGYATKAGISLGIEDLKIPPKKISLLANSERIFTEAQLAYRRGDITGIEKMQLFIETWTETSESLKDEVVSYFEKTDILNPVYMMAFSGARGNMSQVRQLVGMRGLMSDPQGKIIDFPIQSNFREGLTLTEYLISTYGARKGIVDTALRTATAGYLTRRLVDVAQHVVVSKFDCETKRGIFLFDMKEGIKTIYSFQSRLLGRVLAQDIFEEISFEFQNQNDPNLSNLSNSKVINQRLVKIASRNQEINSVLASKISKLTKKALVRSPLTCQTRKLVCQLCYGWSLSTSKLVAIGEAVGVIAGQSIGEPGTQLTMRTFHTGGVFSSTVTEQINSPFEALIEYSEPIAGTCIRTSQGNLAFLTKTSGTLFCKKYENNSFLNIMNTYKIPAFTLLFARHGQFVKKDDLLAQVSAFPVSQKTTQIIEQTIYSSLEGEVFYRQLDLLNDVEEKYGERLSKSEKWAQVWVLSAKILKTSLNANFFPDFGDYISKNSVIHQIEWIPMPSSSDEIHLKSQCFQRLKNSPYSEKYINNYIPRPCSQKNSISTFFQNSLGHPTTAKFLKSNNKKKIAKNAFKILSHYNIKDNFLLNRDLLLNKNNLRILLTSNFLVNFKKPLFHNFPKILNYDSDLFERLIKKSFLVSKSDMKQTGFNYPYQPTTRFYLTKILTKSSLTLPLLKPGVLKTWVTAKKNQNIPAHSFKPESLSLSFQNIRKLNLNKKFQTLRQYNNPNFLYPLILSNTIPFYLKAQSLKNYLHAKNLSKNFQIELLKKEVIQKFVKKIKISSSINRLMFDNKFSLKIQNSPKLALTFNLNSSSKSLLKSLLPTKFEYLSFNNTILSFKTSKTVYKKLGYLSYIFIEKDKYEKFLSFLSLDMSSSINSSKMKLVQFISTKLKNSKVNSIPIKTLGLENTYQWAPNSTIGFSWFPSFSHLKSSGLFLVNPGFFLYKNFFLKLGLNHLKNPKFNLLYIQKYHNVLNLAQSQILKKQSFLSPSSNHLLDLTISEQQLLKNFKTFIHLPSVTNVFLLTNKTNIFNGIQLFKEELWDLKPKTFPKYMITKQINLLATSKLLKVREKPQNKNFSQLLMVGKRTDNFLKGSVSNLLATFIPFRNESLEFSLQFPVKYEIEKKQNLNFNSNKFISFKKRTLALALQQNLVMRFDPFEKLGVHFQQFEFIPQENYILKAMDLMIFEKEFFSQNFNVSFLKNSNHLKSRTFNLYLTNAQGFKKEFQSLQEGFLIFKKRNLSLESNFLSSQMLDVKVSTKSVSLKNEMQVFSGNPENFTKFFFLNFNKQSSQEVLNSNNFKKIKMLKNIEFASESNILNYLKTRAMVEIFEKQLNKNNFASRKFVSISTKSNSSFFTFIPFLKEKKFNKKFENKAFRSISQKVLQIKSSKIQTNEFHINIKPGWIYKFDNLDNVFEFHKRIFEAGSLIVDNISFNCEKVFTELIPIQNVNFQNNFFRPEISGGKFEKTSIKKNLNCRFFRTFKEEKSKNFNKVYHSLYLLIRPFQSYTVPNLQDMKKNLYNSVQQNRLNESNTSYFLYNQYFSENFNQQKKLFRTISNFAPLDLNINSENLFSFSKNFYQLQKEKNSKIKSKVNNQINSLKIKEKNLKVSFYLLKFLLTNSLKKFRYKASKPMIYKPKFWKINQFKIEKFKIPGESPILYFSNYSINFFKLTISLNVSNLKVLDFSFSKIFFNLNNSNVYLFQNFSRQIYKKLKVNYLNLLIFRNQLKTSNFPFLINTLSLNRKNNKIEENLNFENLFLSSMNKNLTNKKTLKSQRLFKKKLQYFLALTSSSVNYSSLSRFQYVFDQTYSFLANQRLLATSFHKKQYQSLLTLNVFQNQSLTLKHSKNKHFLQKEFQNRTFSESYYSIPLSKNKFVFKDQSLSLKPSFNLTNFYSPFEGEILKDYLDESNLENLKKSLNINIENGLLSERQSEKLILTNSDVFGLRFPTSKKFSQKFKVNIPSLSVVDPLSCKDNFFKQQTTKIIFDSICESHQIFNMLEKDCFEIMNSKLYTISEFETNYRSKNYRVKNLNFYLDSSLRKFRLGNFIKPGDKVYSNVTVLKSGQVIHLNSKELTLRKAEFFSISPKAILHTYNGHSISKNTPVMTLPFETLKTGDIVQGIPKVEQYLEARTTIQGRLFLNSLPVLLHAIYQRYSQKLKFEKAVRQSFLKIQQILVDGVQRVYRSQGVSIADKHLEIIVRQMTSKVKIVYGGQTGFFAGELVELEFVERINQFLMVKIQYEPVVLGITRSSLEVDSFLSAASFQQTTKVLTKAALENKKDFLKGLKENLLVGNLLPAGTGYVIPLS